MPVLNAEALDNDPKGAAFLLSVLRQVPPAKVPTKQALTGDKIVLRRVMKRLKEPLLDRL